MNKSIKFLKLYKVQVVHMIRRFIKGETVHDILRPFMFVCQLTVLTPYKLATRSGNAVIVYYKPYVLFITIVVLFYSYSIYVVTKTRETVVGHFHGTILFEIGDLFRIYSYLLISIINVIGIFVNKHLYSVILKLFSDIDDNLTLLGIDKHYERIKFIPYLGLFVIMVIFFSSFAINDSLANTWDSKPSVFLWMVIFIPNNASTYYVAIYCTVVLVFNYDLKILNEELQKMAKNEMFLCVKNIYSNFQILTSEIKSNAVMKTNKDLKLDRITIIWTVYDAICDGASNMNRLYGLRILTIVGVSFTSSVFNCFFVWSVYFSIMQGDDATKNYTFLIYCFQEIFINWGRISVIIYVCNNLKKQVKVQCIK